MNTVDLLRQQLTQSRDFLAGTMADIDEESAHAVPPGILNPIAPTYAHIVTGEDGFVNGLLRGGRPLLATSWAGQAGLSEPAPNGIEWNEWARRVRVDLGAFREYAGAVAAESDAWLASLSPDALERSVDLSSFGFGQRTIAWVLGAGVIGHIQSHWGEICALKGVDGGKGFPV
jgi:hypothetical protein